jgi:dipeptidyl-peptidase 4
VVHSSVEETLTSADYDRAASFLPWNVRKRVSGLSVRARWFGASDRFWYEKDDGAGQEIVVVDPERRECRRAFDMARFAKQLEQACGRPVSAGDLSFKALSPSGDGYAVEIVVDDQEILYHTGTNELQLRSVRAHEREAVRSPDGEWDAFVRDHNLWVRATSTGMERPLTRDGTNDRPYGVPLPSPLVAAGMGDTEPPVILWAPDSSRILSHQLDQRDAPRLHFLQSVPLDGSLRPRILSVAYPLPGDQCVPTVRAVIADPLGRDVIYGDHDPVPVLYYGSPMLVWRWSWDRRGDRVYLVTADRGYQGYRLIEVNAHTGSARTLVTEHSQTGVAPSLGGWSLSPEAPSITALESGEVLWWSQRDDWAHLYLYDGETGAQRRQVTSGAWVVNEVLHVDEQHRRVLIAACGREPGFDPYLRLVYSVSLDGGHPVLLTPENADHRAQVSPTGRFFVDTASRWDEPPVTFLRDATGSIVLELQRADVEDLHRAGWRPPRRIKTKARDGSTDVYGLMFRSTTFDPAIKYPIVDFIYGGPQTNQAGASFADSARPPVSDGITSRFWHAQALAELGFVVVLIDGLGMPNRSKSYQDVSWRNLADAGIADHIAAYHQLAADDKSLDLHCIGIFGHSAGGYASTHAVLQYPEVYKVCVSSSGNHDHRLDKASWVERYMGLPVGDHYQEQANAKLAANLKGRLFLIHGDMDENVHISSTMMLVDALVTADKDFDLLILPNRSHSIQDDPYVTRVRWDYFVRHLLGATPPSYRIAGPNGKTSGNNTTV